MGINMEPLLELFQSLVPHTIIAMLALPFLAAFLAVAPTQNIGLSGTWLARYTYIWSRIVLDIGLVWGIALACIGLIGMTVYLKEGGTDISGLGSSVIIVFSCVVTAGLAAAVAFSVEKENVQVPIQLSTWHALLVIVVAFGLTYFNIAQTGVRFLGGFFPPTITGMQLLLVALITLISSRITSTPWQQTLFKANVGVTLFLMALGIVSWFLNWSDFENSQQSTYLIACFLLWGSMVHVYFYFIVLATEKQPDAKLRIKTWHFTEAFAFFAFLIYAPIGTTEYFRESADQDALQEQHENQQTEIDSLKAEIEELKRQIST